MKILHTSDWHLGHTLYNYDRSHEQRDMMLQVASIAAAEQPDALLVSGDVFHTANPSAEAFRMLTDGLLAIHDSCPAARIVVTAGNHDSAARLDAQAALWARSGVTVVATTRLAHDGSPDLDRHLIELPGRGWVAAVPYVYPANFPDCGGAQRERRQAAFFQAVLDRAAERNTAGLPVVLMAHLAVSGSDFTGHDGADGNVGTLDVADLADLGRGYDYAALGHIHRPQNIGARARYCGTPLPVSFDEQCEHSVSIVELNGHDAPTVRTARITNPRPLHTLPADHALPIDELLDLAGQFDSDEPAYLRLNLEVSGFVPADARERAAHSLEGKQCRFCTFAITRPDKHDNGTERQLMVEELRQLDPLEVARMYVSDTTGERMTPELEQMMNQAIALAGNDSEQA